MSYYQVVTTLVRVDDDRIAPVTVGHSVQRLDEPEPRSDYYQWHAAQQNHLDEGNGIQQFTVLVGVTRVKIG